MNFQQKYPDFGAIEAHIHRARVQRAVVVSGLIVDAVQAVVGGLRKAAAIIGRNVAAESDRRAIESDAFLKRSVPKY